MEESGLGSLWTTYWKNLASTTFREDQNLLEKDEFCSTE
jgi:hypothetical protein